jgi:glycosyltransferase involved in cell wall biosynthesis
MLLTVLIPVYNESATIREIVRRVEEQPFETELLIVDDGSTDGTRDLLRDGPWPDNVRILYHERNQGKGAALRTGLREARGDVAWPMSSTARAFSASTAPFCSITTSATSS